MSEKTIYVVRNGIEIDERTNAKLDDPDVSFSMACQGCDAFQHGTFAEAVIGGWREIFYDDAASWNYLGMCPQCCADARKQNA